jgi:hypothetical protein
MHKVRRGEIFHNGTRASRPVGPGQTSLVRQGGVHRRMEMAPRSEGPAQTRHDNVSVDPTGGLTPCIPHHPGGHSALLRGDVLPKGMSGYRSTLRRHRYSGTIATP